MIVLGVDPGTKATGYAFYDTDRPRSPTLGVLRAAGQLAATRRWPMAHEIRAALGSPNPVDLLVIEWQHVRPGVEKDPNAILEVAAVAGMALAVCGVRAARILLPIPSDWKGTIPKEIKTLRILEEAGIALDGPELRHIIPSLRHNAIDALGLARWGAQESPR